MRLAILCLLCAAHGCSRDLPLSAARHAPGPDGAYDVYPGTVIQDALDAAAADPRHKRVRVHPGTYRPAAPAQALVYFSAEHDGITLEAAGDVVLSAANPEVADQSAKSFPAIVNHVVFFGDGISPKTVLRGFTITGANNFVTMSEGRPLELIPRLPQLQKGLFFYADGGGIKIFGRSYPTIANVEVRENYASPCGGGVSIEHRGLVEDEVRFRNCIFRNNRCQITGSAVDLLAGSAARIENCLFVGNISNTGEDYVGGTEGAYNREHGSGALTVFAGSRVTVDRSTFTGNWNGADDKSTGSRYTRSIFWRNNAAGGISPGKRYELDILDGSGVRDCFLNGDLVDLRDSIARDVNTLEAPDPRFDARYIPQAAEYHGVGYRPAR